MCSKAEIVKNNNNVSPQRGNSNNQLEKSIQRVFQESFDQYARTHSLPLHYHKAARHIMDCRTVALGGHAVYCEDGHLDGVWYNSCRDRNCPQCQGINLIRWVEDQEEMLLDCIHHHITFTIPYEYHIYWQLNTSIMMDLLFKAVSETLTDFLVNDPDKKHLDALPGFILALHTWGRNIWLHPHIHCIISDGGLDASGQWASPKGSCFLPIRAVMKKFRGKLSDFIRQAALNPDWVFPEETSHQQLVNLTNKLGRKKWNVYIKAGFKTTKSLLTYLVSYIKGGPLKNKQIVSVTEATVTFRYYPHKDNPDGKKQHGQLMKLTHEQFFDRYLQHIPEPRKQTIRRYGLYSNGKSEALNQARVKLGQSEIDKSSGKECKTWEECLSQFDDIEKRTHCKICGKPLNVIGPLPYPTSEQNLRGNERAPPIKKAA